MRIRPFRLFGIEADTIYGVDREHDTPYLTRVTAGRLRLHIFWRGDQDPDCHSHPWGFWTFPLTPYLEQVAHEIPCQDCVGMRHYGCWCNAMGQPGPYELRTQVVKAWRPHRREATHTHRVLGRAKRPKGVTVDNHWHIWPGPVVTLVWRDRSTGRPWGFLKSRGGVWCWQDWRTYIFGGGKHAPCELPEYTEGESEEVEAARWQGAINDGNH